MKALSSVESLALFGSYPRGDHDCQSDKDILIVANCDRQHLNGVFIERGYSPSFYSLAQLENLAADGSLFIQHLKQEARLVVDRDEQLGGLLRRFTPKRDYTDRLCANRSLFEITMGVPNCNITINWAFDVLAVAFRNHAILYFAQQGIYEFSFAALVKRISSEFALTESEVTLLRELRSRKHQYRLHPSLGDGAISTLHRTQMLMEKIVSVKCFSVALQPHEYIANLDAIPTENAHWYYNLRRFEGIFRAMGHRFMHDSCMSSSAIEKLFAQPSPYCDTGGNSILWLCGELQRLRSL